MSNFQHKVNESTKLHHNFSTIRQYKYHFSYEKKIIQNRIYKYAEEIWGDVLSELFHASDNESLRKTDNLKLSLSKKMNAVNNFNPALLFCHETLKM